MPAGGCSKWWKNRTSLEKTLIIFSFIIVLTCIILILVGNVRRSILRGMADDICSTQLCIKTAGTVLSKADLTVDPCTDFYEYACGQYTRTHAIPYGQSQISVADETTEAMLLNLKEWLESSANEELGIKKKAKALFDSCMAYDRRMENASSILNKTLHEENFSSWPDLDPVFDEDEVSFEKTLGWLTHLDIPFIVQLDIVPDSANADRFVPKFSIAKPFLKARVDQMFQDDTTYEKKVFDLMHGYVEDTLHLLGFGLQAATSYAKEVVTTERTILKIIKKANAECAVNASYVRDYTIERFPTIDNTNKLMYTDDLDWNVFLDYIFEGYKSKNVTDFPIEMYCRRHIRDMAETFTQTTMRSSFSYLLWRFLSSISPYLGPKFYMRYTEFEQEMNDDENKPSQSYAKWKICLSLVEQQMSPVLAITYRNRSLTEATLNEKIKIATAIRSTLLNQFSSSKWLNKEEIKDIIQKIKNTKFELPTANYLFDLQMLDQWFSQLDLDQDNVVSNLLKLRRFSVQKRLKRLISPNEKYLHWDDIPLVATGVPKYEADRIVIHFDKMRRPYLNTDQQGYFNYGGFGTFLARELNNAIDAMMNKAFGHNSVWDLFRNSKDGSCLLSDDGVSHINNGDGHHEKFVEALKELSALQASYKAYTETDHEKEQSLPALDLCSDQMFFLSYAQTMCEVREELPQTNTTTGLTSRQRVNFALKHSAEFSSAFSCPEKSAMNPSPKCQLT